MGLDNSPGLCIGRISVMRYPHITKLDLDLLVHLAVLLQERHVTRAANRCFLSQSAMSRQLERLREALGDELLLRTGRVHERTARGEQLLRELEPLLPRIEGILQGRSFDPEKSKDQFQVTTTDYACMVLLPELVKRTSKFAPN
jgi:DNA-binding transcriptional LysR family regulator